MAEQQVEVQNGNTEKVAAAPPAAVVIKEVRPQLVVEAPKAEDAIQFYKAAFGAEELDRATHPKRKADQERPYILSAQLKLGSSVFIVSDNIDAAGEPLKNVGSGSFALWLEAEDIEATVAKAVAAGAVAEGDISTDDYLKPETRVGKVRDPFGYIWNISSSSSASAAVETAPAAQPRVLVL